MKHQQRICTLFLCFFMLSCQWGKVPVTTVRFQNQGGGGRWTRVSFPDNGVERDVPNVYANNILHGERLKIQSALGIGSLENGYFGQQVRVSGSEPGEYPSGWNRFLVFTKHSSWSAELYYIRYAVEEGFLRTIDSLQFQKHALDAPRSGWKYFMDSVTTLGLFSLPDYAAVDGYRDDLNFDEFSYEVEVGKKAYYRIYSYPDPFPRSNRFAEAGRFTALIQYIRSEFHFPQPYTPGIIKN